MYRNLFIGAVILFICIKYPIVLLGAAVIIAVNWLLQHGAHKPTAEPDVASDVIYGEAPEPMENIGEKLPKFAAGFTHHPDPDNMESVDECEFVMKENDVYEFIKPYEMPSFSGDSGSFHIRF